VVNNLHYSHLTTRLKHRTSDIAELTGMGRRRQQVHFCSDQWTYLGFTGVNGQSYRACDLSPQALAALTNADGAGCFYQQIRSCVDVGGERRSVKPITEHRTSKGLYTLSMFHWFMGAAGRLSRVGRRRIGGTTRNGWLHKSGPTYGKP
jgi:hypothetical protein